MTPYYEHAGISIYHADCREIMPTLPLFVSAVVTDPPYAVSVSGSVHTGRPGNGSRRLDFFKGDDDWPTMIATVREAMTMARERLAPNEGLTKLGGRGPLWTGEVRLIPEMLSLPLRWKQPRRIFVNSMSDLFHESLPDEAIAAVFGVMAACPQHTFQVLTKRADRLATWFAAMAPRPHNTHGIAWDGRAAHCWDAACRLSSPSLVHGAWSSEFLDRAHRVPWPLPNVWIGISVEDQQRADERIPHLLRVPAAVRFLSCEPLLEAVDLRQPLGLMWHQKTTFHTKSETFGPTTGGWAHSYNTNTGQDVGPEVDWIIVGGESGSGARPMRLEWARSIVDQCKAAGVAVFVKQLGARPAPQRITYPDGRLIPPPGNEIHPHMLELLQIKDRKGGDMSEWPEDLRVREFPRVDVSHG